MDRRDALKLLGAGALGSTALGRACADHDRGADPAANPANNLHAYLCAFHIAKKDPKFIVEAHHYCSAINDDVHQCIIFDKNGKNARILGVEYIISDAVYQSLPDAEKKYYHPHRFEVIGGLLIAPGMPAGDEKQLMEKLVTTWGKTWHTWPDPKTALPLGEPLLMWSNTREGQIDATMLAERDRKFGVQTEEIRKRRSYLGSIPDVEPPKSVDEIGRQQ